MGDSNSNSKIPNSETSVQAPIKYYKIVEPGSNDPVMGDYLLPETNVYICAYAKARVGQKKINLLQVGESSLCDYRLSGSSGTYRVVRMK